MIEETLFTSLMNRKGRVDLIYSTLSYLLEGPGQYMIFKNLNFRKTKREGKLNKTKGAQENRTLIRDAVLIGCIVEPGALQ